MKTELFATALLIAASAGALIAQQPGKAEDPSKAIYAAKATIDATLSKGGPATTPRAAMISRGTDHLVAAGRRDAPGVAERHEKDLAVGLERESVALHGAMQSLLFNIMRCCIPSI